MFERVNPWILLGCAVVFEVIGSTSLKASHNFARPLPSLLVVVGFGLTFYLVALIVKRLPLGLVYALWGGLGTALTALGGALFFGESLGGLQLLALLGIIAGVSVLQIASRGEH